MDSRTQSLPFLIPIHITPSLYQKFNIKKKIENDFIIKDIEFEDEGKHFSFREEVRVLFLEDFHQFYMHAGLEIISIYGDYHLNEFKIGESPRLIMITRKL